MFRGEVRPKALQVGAERALREILLAPLQRSLVSGQGGERRRHGVDPHAAAVGDDVEPKRDHAPERTTPSIGLEALAYSFRGMRPAS